MSTVMSKHDLKCRCGKVLYDANQRLLSRILVAQDLAATTFDVRKTWVCESCAPTGANAITKSHIQGCAIDIVCKNSPNRYDIISALIRTGFSNIGIYPEHIHADFAYKDNGGLIWIGQLSFNKVEKSKG